MHKEALQNQLLQNEAKIASLEAELRQVHSLNMQQSERYQQSLCESAGKLYDLSWNGIFLIFRHSFATIAMGMVEWLLSRRWSS